MVVAVIRSQGDLGGLCYFSWLDCWRHNISEENISLADHYWCFSDLNCPWVSQIFLLSRLKLKWLKMVLNNVQTWVNGWFWSTFASTTNIYNYDKELDATFRKHELQFLHSLYLENPTNILSWINEAFQFGLFCKQNPNAHKFKVN